MIFDSYIFKRKKYLIYAPHLNDEECETMEHKLNKKRFVVINKKMEIKEL